MDAKQEDFVAEIERDVTKAYELAEARDIEEAVELFDKIRDFCERPELKIRADKLEGDFKRSVSSERDQFRAFISQRNPAEPKRRVVILADSLGLPRPAHPKDFLDSQPTTYALALQQATRRRAEIGGPPTAIDPLCQRYATSDTVLENMALASLEGADVIVHVGLNDFSRRIFMERQRLAMKLLPADLVNRIVRFSQVNMYRADIIRHFNDFAYVSLEDWTANIGTITEKAKAAGARSVTWFTIIQLPMKVESHTPYYRYNVLRYNLALYEAHRHGLIDILDIDRMFWEQGFESHVDADLMHLSLKGHTYVANRLMERFFDLKVYPEKS